MARSGLSFGMGIAVALNRDIYGDKCPRCPGVMHKSKKLPSTVLCGRCGHAMPRKGAQDQSDQAWFTDRALGGAP